MKRRALFRSSALHVIVLSSSPLFACAGAAPRDVLAPPTLSAAEVPVAPRSAPASAPRPAATAAPREEATVPSAPPTDPLDGAISGTPAVIVTRTPARELRAKTRGDLDLALRAAESSAGVDAAAATLTRRLGKPSWSESTGGATLARVWVAPDGSRCHRLVLHSDGSLEVEVSPKTQWLPLVSGGWQSSCTGETRSGLMGD